MKGLCCVNKAKKNSYTYSIGLFISSAVPFVFFSKDD